MSEDVISFFGIKENYEALEGLAGMGYSQSEMALYFGLNENAFKQAASIPDSPIDYHIRRGILLSRAEEDLSLQKNAATGHPKSISLLASVKYRKNFEAARRGIMYDCEVSNEAYSKLEAYIESGCKDKLKPGEALYLEILSMMHSMTRRYGRAKCMRFFQEPPFGYSYADTRAMYEHAINLFYADHSVERKALRNLKAQQLEDAAEMVLATAKEPKDFEIYGKLISESAKIRQLDQPDPDPVPKQTYARPFKFYSMDPKTIGIERVDRNELARQIDAIRGATEAEKRKARIDAGIEEIAFEDILNEHKEENQS